MGKKCCTRICAPALGMGFGIASGLMMMLFVLAAWKWSYGTAVMDLYAAIYPGVNASLMGGVYAGLWGLLDGFVFGLVAGWIYNCCARCCGCGKSCSVCNDQSGNNCSR